MALQLFLFDIAGTIMEDGPYASTAYRDVMHAHELHASDDWLRHRMGRKKAHVFAELLQLANRDPQQAGDLARAFETSINQQLTQNPPREIPGASDTLHRLREMGMTIGFTTGFARSTADMICNHFGWNFDVGVASDEIVNGRPAPDLIVEAMKRAAVIDANEVATVGDTPNDLIAGHAAGCACIIGTLHGTHTREELQPHPHTELIDGFQTFFDIINCP